MTVLFLSLALACGGAGKKSNTPAGRRTGSPGELMSYRLLLRDNPVDPGGAFRCYGRCQDRETPKAYVECLEQCPGFEIDPGVACDEHDVPPAAACLTVRKVPVTKEPDPASVVLAIVGSYALVVGLASVCATSRSQCGSVYSYPPPH